jgi:alpha-N-acetylglucosaminidase
LNYTASDLLPAWDALILAADSCKNSDGFQFDLVDVTRQVLANYALPLQQKIARAYQQQDTFLFTAYSRQFINLIEDMDKLLATRKEFLLGNWVADARKWGVDEKEKALYEFNAKDLITLWGDQNCPLNEYACRQWSGLLNDFYKPRWQQFFKQLLTDLKAGKGFNKTEFTKQIKGWEWQWVNTRKDYPIVANGNPIEMSVKMFLKYRSVIAEN